MSHVRGFKRTAPRMQTLLKAMPTTYRCVKNPVNFVFLANAFHGVPDRPRLVKAVKSILVPDGRFAVLNWHRRPREETMILGEPRGPKTELRVPPDETIAAVEGAGLKLVQLVEVPPYHYGAVFGNWVGGPRDGSPGMNAGRGSGAREQ